jgi:hypothetical protein
MTEAISTTLFNSVMEKENTNISINSNETIYAQRYDIWHTQIIL